MGCAAKPERGPALSAPACATRAAARAVPGHCRNHAPPGRPAAHCRSARAPAAAGGAALHLPQPLLPVRSPVELRGRTVWPVATRLSACPGDLRLGASACHVPLQQLQRHHVSRGHADRARGRLPRLCPPDDRPVPRHQPARALCHRYRLRRRPDTGPARLPRLRRGVPGRSLVSVRSLGYSRPHGHDAAGHGAGRRRRRLCHHFWRCGQRASPYSGVDRPGPRTRLGATRAHAPGAVHRRGHTGTRPTSSHQLGQPGLCPIWRPPVSGCPVRIPCTHHGSGLSCPSAAPRAQHNHTAPAAEPMRQSGTCGSVPATPRMNNGQER